jgi:endonuclease/exonuclease/phosphatase family metal-dependent hydrolase
MRGPTRRKAAPVRSRGALAVLAALVSLLLAGAPAVAAPPEQAQRLAQVGSYNLFLGGDIGSLLPPGVDTLPEFAAAASRLWQDVVASDFPERAGAVADLLAPDPPDVVGLQEVALWRATALVPGAAAPSYDFLQLLLDELAERGTPYRVLATNTNFVSPTIPLPTGVAVQYTDRDVIIARADVRTSELKVLGTQSHLFAARVPITLPFSTTPGQPGTQISIVRGWSSVDIKTRGKTYRFVNTHLEAFSPVVRQAQAAELAAALADSPYPVVLAGDLNDDPGTGAVALLTRALGLADAWVTGSGAGFTAGQANLRGPPTFNRRIDYVLYQPDRRPALEAVRADVIGEELADRTPSGLWPSDHAGILATIRISPP